MYLENFPNIRVKRYPKGWAVEIQLKKWWGKKYWKHIISVSGINEMPWYYKSKEIAIEEASIHFKNQLLYNNN